MANSLDLLAASPSSARVKRPLAVALVSLALLLFAAPRGFAAQPPPPRHGSHLIVVNDDGFSAFFSGDYKTADDLRARVRSLADTPVAVLEWCIVSGSRANFPAQSVELVGTGVTDFPRRGDKLAAETLHRLASAGTDTLAVVAEACREVGIACYASLRMNGDYNDTWMGETLPGMFNSNFWRAHPEFRVRGKSGEDRTKLSYAFSEVRAFRLALLREAAEHDIAGINLDFLRHPDFFGYEQPLLDAFRARHGLDPRTLAATDPRWLSLRAEIMTGFVRDVRQMLDAVGQRKGRRLGLSARIDWKAHHAVGCDHATWLKEGLLDYLVVGQRSLGGYEFDLAPFVTAAAGSGCAVLFGEEAILTGNDLTRDEDKLVAAGKIEPPKRAMLSLDQYRERSARWYAAGAAGLHLFNENRPEILRALRTGSTTPAFTLAAADRAGPHEVTVVEFDLPDSGDDAPLPLKAYLPSGSGPFPIVVFSHGLGGSRDGFAYLARHWASHGYVCLHPTHNDTAAIAANPKAGVRKQRASSARRATRLQDIRLVLDALEKLPSTRPEFADKLDPSRIGLAGHSAGAFTVQITAGAKPAAASTRASTPPDPRIKAVMAISGRGIGRGGFTADSWSALKLPFMVVTGGRDTGVGYFGDQTPERRTDAFRHAPPRDKYLLFIEPANHSSFGGVPRLAGEPPVSADELQLVQRAMCAVTTSFWHTYIKASPEARAALEPSAVAGALGADVRLETR